MEGGDGRRLLEPSFSVTHVDAHADLGLGDAGYIYLLTELVFQPIEARRWPNIGPPCGLTDGNYLAFAVACQWLADLTYVFNGTEGRPGDLMVCVMEGFDTKADHIQLAGLEREAFNNLLMWHVKPPTPLHLEPKVPFEAVPWPAFQAQDSFDFIGLARSPEFTPPESDELFDEIRDRFIDELGGEGYGDPPPLTPPRTSREW